MESPILLIDTREQAPLSFTTFPSEVSTLPTGDYSVRGLEDTIAVERKSVSDLIGSLTSGRERFQREVQRMLAHRSRTLLIVGDGTDPKITIKDGHYRSQARPQSILALDHSLQLQCS